MRLPAVGRRIVASVDSTQRLAAELLRDDPNVGAVLAREQMGGRGRFGRAWHSPPGTSLSLTLILREYRDWPAPQFVGMAVAIAAASALDCRLAWPNDLMIDGRKLGGVLTEIVDGVPLVGIGANLNQEAFPEEIAHRATSLRLERGSTANPKDVMAAMIGELRGVPEPTSFAALARLWAAFDATPGKRYRLPSGEEAVATGVGDDGRLFCTVGGKERSVMAADALFG